MKQDKSENWLRLSVLTFGMILILLGATAWIRSHSSSVVQSNVPKDKAGITLQEKLNSPDPVIQDSAQQSLVNRALVIRSRWKQWAETHKELIRQIRDGHSSDEATVSRYYEAIMFDAGQSPHLVGVHGSDLNTPEGQFNWNCAPIANEYWDSASESYSTSAGLQIRTRFMKIYSQCHDIPISQSMNLGNRLTIWASGQITEEAGRRADVGKTGKQIAPPFDL